MLHFKILILRLYSKMKKVLYIVFLIQSIFCNGQKESNYWYFGNKAGLNFNTNPISPLKNSSLQTFEGSSVISDANGNLLFYTDGKTVWNKKNQIMANGTGLSGNPSATQSGVIVPGDNYGVIYYIFTVGMFRFPKGIPNTKLEYSIVDMSLEGGLGRVTHKNKALFTSDTPGNIIASSEKIAAIQHTNRRDFWVIAHDFRLSRMISTRVPQHIIIGEDEIGSGDKFYVYLVSDKGVSAPKIYNIGKTHYDPRGYMKISRNGKYLAVAVVRALQLDFSQKDMSVQGFYDKEKSFIEVFNFDNKTGVLSKRNTGLSLVENKAPARRSKSFYGLEFSENSKYLYASERFEGKLYQFEIDSGKEKVIDNKNIANALQLAPDGKIYAAMSREQPEDFTKYLGETHLGAIENGNTTNPTFNPKALDLGGNHSYEGLPTIVMTFYNAVAVASSACLGKVVEVKINTKGYTDYVLEMGDGTVIQKKIPEQNIINESHGYLKAGTYKITVTLKRGSISKQINRFIRVFALPEKPILTTSKIELCNTRPTKGILKNFRSDHTYKWQDSEGKFLGNGKEQIFTQVGNYKVVAKNKNGCESTTHFVVEQFKHNISKKDFNITHSEQRKGTFTFFDKDKIARLSQYFEFAVKALDDPQDEKNIPYQSTIYFQNLDPKTYYFYAREKNGCNIFKFLFSVVDIPKFFSPNGDGVNDLWRIKKFDENFYKITRVYILDKTGTVLMDFDIKEGWNGQDYRGKIMPSDDYWYKIILKSPSDREEIKIGHFSLLR